MTLVSNLENLKAKYQEQYKDLSITYNKAKNYVVFDDTNDKLIAFLDKENKIKSVQIKYSGEENYINISKTLYFLAKGESRYLWANESGLALVCPNIPMLEHYNVPHLPVIKEVMADICYQYLIDTESKRRLYVCYDGFGYSNSPRFTVDKNSCSKPCQEYDPSKCYIREYLDKQAKEFAEHGNGMQRESLVKSGLYNEKGDFLDAIHTNVLRVYLEVPFEEKDKAKVLGAQWDREEKAWYVTADKDVNKFEKWFMANEPVDEKQVLRKRKSR